jgi:hypothetical protein
MATVQHREHAKLKLKRISGGEPTVEHLQCMVKSDLFCHYGGGSIDPHHGYSPCPLPFIDIPYEFLREPYSSPSRHPASLGKESYQNYHQSLLADSLGQVNFFN